MRGIGRTVRRTVFQVGGGYEIFQHNLLALGYLVKLIEVDKGERRQTQVQVMFVLEVDAVIIVFAHVPGKQYPAETRLAAALTTY